MKRSDFWLKVINIVLIVGALAVYNSFAVKHDTKLQKQEKARREAVTQQDSNQSSSSSQKSDSGKYRDGIYQGSAQGYGGPITVKVTIKQGYMTDIHVVSASGEDPEYYNNAVSVLDSMLDAQSADVSAVSGATYSSNGLKNAVRAALQKAGKNGK